MAGDETRRLRALQQYDVLDSDDETAYDDLTKLASQICGTPIAAISLIDKDRQWFKSAVGLGIRQTDRDVAFCGHTIRQDEVFIVGDAARDTRFAANPLVTGNPGIRFYAGTPLIDAHGQALGALCVIDTEPRNLSPAQISALESLGRQAMALLESRRLNAESKAMNRRSVSQLLRIRALHTVSSALIEQRDIGDLQQTVVDLVADALPADRVTIFAMDPGKRAVTHFRKGGPGADAVVPVTFDELWDGLTGWVLRSGTPALSPKSSPDPRERPEVQRRRLATRCGDIIVVPITCKGLILGTITAINAPDGAEFAAEHVELMVAMANQVAVAMQTSKLFAALTDRTIALKGATDRMTLATAAAGMGIWEWELASNQLRGDDQLYRVYRLERGGETESLSFWFDRVHPEDRLRIQCAINEALAHTGEFDQEYRIMWPNGEVRHLKATAQVQRNPAGDPIRMVGVNFDITKRKDAELQLERDARCDKLTNLANRALFMDRLARAIQRIERGQQAHFAVFFLDFDRFKHVNDTLGHKAGDDLLCEIAERLRRALRSSDTLSSDDTGNVVSRFGGDEFLILINDLKSVGDAQVVCKRLLTTLAPAYRIHGTDVNSSASIGVVTSNWCSGTAEEVVRNADLAMYEAKRAGRACSVTYHPSMHSQTSREQSRNGQPQIRAIMQSAQSPAGRRPIPDHAP